MPIVKRSRRYAGLLTALLIAGCDAREGEPRDSETAPVPSATATAAPPDAAEPAEPAPETLVATLAGEWRVAGIDGKPFDEPYGLALSADEAEVWWEPRCALHVRTYRIDGRRITIPAQSSPPIPVPTPGGAPVPPPPPVCAIAVPPRVLDVMRALDAAETVTRTPENGVLIAGGGRSLLLFSQ